MPIRSARAVAALLGAAPAFAQSVEVVSRGLCYPTLGEAITLNQWIDWLAPGAYAVVNPRRPGDPSPDKDLAGAGVAFARSIRSCNSAATGQFRRRRTSLQRAMSASSGAMLEGGGAEALVFRGCAASGTGPSGPISSTGPSRRTRARTGSAVCGLVSTVGELNRLA